MIIVENTQHYVVCCRVNSRTMWRYAAYTGNFGSIEAAIESLKVYLPGQSVLYTITNTETGEEARGEI